MLYRTAPHVQPHTHWGALAFTLLIAIGISALVAQTLSADLLLGPSRRAQSAARPAPTVAPTPSVAAPAASDLHSRLVSQPLPLVIFAGDTTRISLTFRNTGTTAWIKGSAAEARLGIVGEDSNFFSLGLAVDWLMPTRPAVQSEARVEPGQTATFAFDLKGTKPGRYVLPVRLLVEGVTWMEDEAVKVDITVRE